MYSDYLRWYKVNLSDTSEGLRKDIQETAFKKGYGWIEGWGIEKCYVHEVKHENGNFLFFDVADADLKWSESKKTFDEDDSTEITVTQAFNGEYPNADNQPNVKVVNWD